MKTESKTTPELTVGDVVLMYGARILLADELVRRPCCEGHERRNRFGEPSGHCDPEDGHGELVAILGVITNADDPDVSQDVLSLARGTREHRARNGRPVPEGDEPLWTVQGNGLANWTVEVAP